MRKKVLPVLAIALMLAESSLFGGCKTSIQLNPTISNDIFTPSPTKKPVLTQSPSPTIEPTPSPTTIITSAPEDLAAEIARICAWPEDSYPATLLDKTNVFIFKLDGIESIIYIYGGGSDDNDNPSFGESFSNQASVVLKTKGNDTVFELCNPNMKGKFEFLELIGLDTYLTRIGKDPAAELSRIHTYGDLARLYLETVPKEKQYIIKSASLQNNGDTQTKVNIDEVENAEAKMLRTALLNKWLDNELDSYRQANPDKGTGTTDNNKVLEKYREEHNILV